MSVSDSILWTQRLWKVVTVASSGPENLGMAANDYLTFTSPPTTVLFQQGQGPQVWGQSCQITDEGVVGQRCSDGRPFLIQYDPALPGLVCTLTAPPVWQLGSRAAGPSALLGALIGAAAGIAWRQPVAGGLLGIAAALTGSVVTAASLGARTGPNGIWVAEEGGGGRQGGESDSSSSTT